MIKKFKSFAEDKQLDDFEEELINADCPETDTVEIKKEEKMKTLKQHIKEQSKYGKITLEEIKKNCESHGKSIGFEINFKQSNIEGEIVTMIQKTSLPFFICLKIYLLLLVYMEMLTLPYKKPKLFKKTY